MDGCVTEIYLSINVSVNVRISVSISTSISTEYANPDPHAGSVTLITTEPRRHGPIGICVISWAKGLRYRSNHKQYRESRGIVGSIVVGLFK